MRRIPFLVLVIAATLHAADTAPDWVKELSSRALPAYPSDVHSVTLLDEARATVDASGQIDYQVRQAIRIVTIEGRRQALAAIPYIKGTGKIKDFHAWLISPNGFVKAYGKESAVEVALKESFELYDDYRMRYIEARNPEAGATFAWSAEVEEPSLLPQTTWSFQEREPVLLSRCILTLPAGWTAKGTTFNHAPISPAVDGTTYTWQLKDLPPIRKEPSSPRLASLAPHLGITFTPAAGASNAQALTTWQDLSCWMSNLTDSQTRTNEAMAAKVRELTMASKSDYQRIQAIGRHVQNVKYVAIEINLARGGGYQPHLSTDVFAKQYGDCKDKANLMRAMLRLAGINSYLVNIYAGDRDHVQANWPSPEQFNHAIIAIQLKEEVSTPAVAAHPTLGRLLFFDPTDTSTPVGDLPDHEQGSYALIIAGKSGDIVRVPTAPPEANRTDVTVAASLTGDGALEATFKNQAIGQSAADIRRIYAHVQPTDFQKQIESWLSESAKEVSISQLEAKDAFDNEQFGLNLTFKAPSYAQIMQKRLMVFRPAIVERWNSLRLQTGPRLTPVVLNSECYHKQVRVKLPPNFTIDEMPDAANLSVPFGKFASSYKVENGELLFTEELDVTATTVPAERYGEVKDFFERVAGAEEAPLVLVKN